MVLNFGVDDLDEWWNRRIPYALEQHCKNIDHFSEFSKICTLYIADQIA